MLTTCWECEQVIEISSLNEHLINECASRDKYKQCDKCDSVFLTNDFYGHQCVRSQPPGALKCPLCTVSVFPPNQDGFRKHLMEERCPGNNRLPAY